MEVDFKLSICGYRCPVSPDIEYWLAVTPTPNTPELHFMVTTSKRPLQSVPTYALGHLDHIDHLDQIYILPFLDWLAAIIEISPSWKVVLRLSKGVRVLLSPVHTVAINVRNATGFQE